MPETTLQLPDAESTRRLGRALGALVQAGDVIALVGDLGAGKTALSKSLIAALGGVEEDDVTSPTFVLVREYPGRVEALHMDAYRLAGGHDLDALDLEIGGAPVALIEWADRVEDSLPDDRLTLHLFHHDAGRRAELRAGGPRSQVLLDESLQAFASGA